MKEVKLLRPLDGKAEGEKATYPDRDAERLKARGAVEILGDAQDEEVGEKEAEAPANKAAPAPANKSALRTKKKGD